MILVVGGTTEGREVARELAARGSGVLVSTATGHGSELAARDGVRTVQGRLDCLGMVQLIKQNLIRVLLDASHPFAVEVSRNAARACEKTGIPYIRYARPEFEIPLTGLVEKAESYQEAARLACGLGRTIFLASGVKSARLFWELAGEKGSRVVFRVIPDPGTIRGLMEMGVSMADVVAMQGPFSEEMNLALFRQYRVEVVVTKESGREGGLEEKISAAARLGLPVVLIKRPPEPPGAVRSGPEAVQRAMACLGHTDSKGGMNR